DHLEQSLKHMSKAFNKLKMYTKVKKNLVGFLRSTEVTVNKNDGSYNQHMHVLLCVENAYFRKKENYITQVEWFDLWQNALQVNYRSLVNINAIIQIQKIDKYIQ